MLLTLTGSPFLWGRRPGYLKGGRQSVRTALAPACRSPCHTGLQHPGSPLLLRTIHSALRLPRWSPAVETHKTRKKVSDIKVYTQEYFLHGFVKHTEAFSLMLSLTSTVCSVWGDPLLVDLILLHFRHSRVKCDLMKPNIITDTWSYGTDGHAGETWCNQSAH